MINVCFFDLPSVTEFGQYRLETFKPLDYFGGSSTRGLYDLMVGGLNRYSKRRALLHGAEGVDLLYRERDPAYMRMVGDFIDRFRGFDLIVMGAYNFLHPEILSRELTKPTKVLGFVDDPYSTYLRGIPYLWAFDGAYYISPSYLNGTDFASALQAFGCPHTYWWPLVPNPFPKPPDAGERFFRQRSNDLIYVGNPTGSKVDRLIVLKKHLGKRFQVYGRWRYAGYHGVVRGLVGHPIFPHRVRRLSNEQRTSLYWQTKIGFNMHVSDVPTETGNARMYETPAHGMLMVCDKGGGDAHASIFKPNEEAVYYSSLSEAIELIDHYLQHDEERIRIARAGYERFWREYDWEKNLKGLLDWAMTVPKRSPYRRSDS